MLLEWSLRLSCNLLHNLKEQSIFDKMMEWSEMHKYDGNDGLKARVSYATCNFTSAKPVTWIKIKKLESKAAVISHQAEELI